MESESDNFRGKCSSYVVIFDSACIGTSYFSVLTQTKDTSHNL